jgi:hypothetical protein
MLNPGYISNAELDPPSGVSIAKSSGSSVEVLPDANLLFAFRSASVRLLRLTSCHNELSCRRARTEINLLPTLARISGHILLDYYD